MGKMKSICNAKMKSFWHIIENYLGKIVKNVMRTHDQKMELIYCFIWGTYRWGNMVIGNSW